MADRSASGHASDGPDAPLYYASDGVVWKRPIRRANPDGGTVITIGFPVCRMHPAAGDAAADAVADLMNAGDVALNGPVATRGHDG